MEHTWVILAPANHPCAVLTVYMYLCGMADTDCFTSPSLWGTRYDLQGCITRLPLAGIYVYVYIYIYHWAKLHLQWIMDNLQCIMWSCDPWEMPLVFKGHWQYPCTALYGSLPWGLSKECVKDCPQSYTETIWPMASFTKEVILRLAKCPLKTNGHLSSLESTSLVKERSGTPWHVYSEDCTEDQGHKGQNRMALKSLRYTW